MCLLYRSAHACKTFIDKFIDYSTWIIHLVLDVLVCSIAFYYIVLSVLLENTPLVKFIRNRIRDSSGVFSISSQVRISMLLLISSLSLKLYLNSLVYNRNICGSSSKVFGNPWQSLAIFGNLRKISENVQQRSCDSRQILENLRKSSENRQIVKLSSGCLYNKKNITR